MSNPFIVQQVPLNLVTICNGELNEKFLEHQNEIVSKLRAGQKADITIKIQYVKPQNSVTQMHVGADIKFSLPKLGIGSIAQITSAGLITDKPEEKAEYQDLFSSNDRPPQKDVTVIAEGNIINKETGEIVGSVE